jgi:hypothetical protein
MLKVNKASEFMKLFVNRRDVYAVQVKVDEKCIYVPKYETLTELEVQQHLEGKVTLGVYALNVDNTVKWLCFDIDSAHVKNSEEACTVIAERCIQKFGSSAVRIEQSGTPRNFHIWVFFEEPVQAVYARALGRQVLNGLASVELFPKQTALTGKLLGNLVKLPLGLHKKSGKWSVMSLEDIKPCRVDLTEIKILTREPLPEDKPRLEGYNGKNPNCIEKIKKGVKKGKRSNVGIVYASYLYNFKQLKAERAYYLLRLWNTKNKPRLEEEELRLIFEQADKGGYIFGCEHDYLKEFCKKEGCVFNEEDKR